MDTIETKDQAGSLKRRPTRLEEHGHEPRQAPRDFTGIVLAPRWRLGRRGSAKRSVAATLEQLRPLARRTAVACQAAAVATFKEAGADEVLIVPESESPLSALYCALEACPDELVLVCGAGDAPKPDAVAAMFASLRGDDEAGVAAAVDRRGLLEFPLACRGAVRPIVQACLYAGHTSLADLLRRPCARLVAVE